jgi:RNA polymerase sigma factor FliA
MGSQERDPNDSLIPAYEFPEYEEILQLLIERISQLPLTTRRILAMYYYETMPIREIAARFGLPEYRIEETRIETVDLLRKYFLSLSTRNFAAKK